VLPFYSRVKRRDWPAEYWVLWPFFHFTGKPDEGEQFRSRFFFFPFFGWDNTEEYRSFTVLWPFFGFRTRGDGTWSWVGPWPLYRSSKWPRSERIQFWPFYGKVTDREVTRRFIAWPLYSYAVRDTATDHAEQFRSWPFFQTTHDQDKPTQAERRHTVLWPLFRYKSSSDGPGEFTSLALLWFVDPAGFERNYSVFWKLFEVVWDGEGQRSTRLLWRLYRHDRGPDGRRVQLGPLASYRREPTGWRASALLGLFEYGRVDGRHHVRLFYLPVTRRAAVEE
jgi:hypothetical protein